MQYEDPFIDEEIHGNVNVSSEPPFKTFLKLSAALIALLTTGYILLSIFVYQIIGFIPFETEKRWFEPIAQAIVTQAAEEQNDSTHTKTLALQRIADKMINAAIAHDPNHPLAHMEIAVHYSDEDTVNAFALPGGYIVVMRGLIEAMPDENTLAMVIAHEMAHVIHRDSLNSMGRNALTNLIVLSVFGAEGNLLMNQSVHLMATKYSRSDETNADETGLELLHHAYGNAYGAPQLFSTLGKINPDQNEWITLSSTHPSPAEREANMQDRIKQNHYTLDQNSATPLPPELVFENVD